jgi:hypothetical protein
MRLIFVIRAVCRRHPCSGINRFASCKVSIPQSISKFILAARYKSPTADASG